MVIVHETENEHIATSQQTTVLIVHPVENLVKCLPSSGKDFSTTEHEWKTGVQNSSGLNPLNPNKEKR